MRELVWNFLVFIIFYCNLCVGWCEFFIELVGVLLMFEGNGFCLSIGGSLWVGDWSWRVLVGVVLLSGDLNFLVCVLIFWGVTGGGVLRVRLNCVCVLLFF